MTVDFDALHRASRNVEEAVGAALVDALASLDATSRAALVAHSARAVPAKGADAP